MLSSPGVAQQTTSPQTPHIASKSLPADICAEAIIATVIVVIGLVMGSDKLRPIRWHAWAGKVEREGAAGFLDGSGEVEQDYRGNPFGVLETRPGFTNIRKQRREFAAWARSEKSE